MFDPAQIFTVTFQSGGKKTCQLRYPTAEQWAQRARQTKQTRQQLGGGITKKKSDTEVEASAELFDQVVVSDASGYDEYDKRAVIERLDRTEATSIAYREHKYCIRLRVYDHDGKPVETQHVLNGPTARQRMRYEDSVLDVENKRRTHEIRRLLEPAETLYNATFVAAGGYAPDEAVKAKDIPITHKAKVVDALIEYLEDDQDEPDPEA